MRLWSIWAVLLSVGTLRRWAEAECDVRESWLEVAGRDAAAEGRPEPRARSSQACREACRDDAACRAFAFSALRRRCRLLDRAPGDLLPGDQAGDEGWRLGQAGSLVGLRWCPSRELVDENCWSAEVEPGMLLLGFAERVVNASSVAECADACRNSREDWGFRCRSAVFYRQGDGNCILQAESKEDEGALFGAAEEWEASEVAFVSLPCAPRRPADLCEGRLRTLPGYLQGFELAQFPDVSRRECQRLCLQDSMRLFPFQCRSLNYYKYRRLCTLSPEDKDSEPAFFWDQDFSDNTLYIDLSCANQSSSRN